MWPTADVRLELVKKKRSSFAQVNTYPPLSLCPGAKTGSFTKPTRPARGLKSLLTRNCAENDHFLRPSQDHEFKLAYLDGWTARGKKKRPYLSTQTSSSFASLPFFPLINRLSVLIVTSPSSFMYANQKQWHWAGAPFTAPWSETSGQRLSQVLVTEQLMD